MALTLLKNIGLDEVKSQLSVMLTEGIASPNVRKLAEKAVSNRQDQIAAIFNFVRDTFPYAEDPKGFELFIHPNRMALDYFNGRIRQGDCDDLALLSGAMLGSIGHRVRIALLATGGYEIDHAITQVYSEALGRWINVDCASTNPLGWEISSGRSIYAEPK